jgi:hypothetical protein
MNFIKNEDGYNNFYKDDSNWSHNESNGLIPNLNDLF